MKRFLVILGLVLMLVNTIPSDLEASDGVDLPYQVTAKLPSNQIEGVTGMIALVRDSLEDQVVEFEVENISDKEITLLIKPLNAVAGSYGGIQYIETNFQGQNYITSNILFTDIVEIESEITLKPRDRVIVSGKVKPSEIKEFNQTGEILGGVAFKEKRILKDNSTEYVTIDNEFQTVIGVNLIYTNEGYFLDDSIKLDKSYVEKLQAYFQVNLPITFNNKNTLYGVSVDYEVKDSSDNIVFKGNKLPFNVAPYTHNDLSLVWEGVTFNYKESYKLSGVIKYEDQEYPFNEDVDITYTPPEISKTRVTKNTVPLLVGAGSTNNYIIVIITLIIIIVITIVILERRGKFFKPDTSEDKVDSEGQEPSTTEDYGIFNK